MSSEAFTSHVGGLASPLALPRHGESEYRNLSLARDVDSADIRIVGQVESFAVLAAIDLSFRSPGFLHVAARLLLNVIGVVPALQVAAADLPLRILLVAGALPDFLDFHFVVGKLRSLGCGFSCRQVGCPHSLRRRPPDSPPQTIFYSMLSSLEAAGIRTRA